MSYVVRLNNLVWYSLTQLTALIEYLTVLLELTVGWSMETTG